MAPHNHKEKNMKSSIVRGVLIFAAGAGCATVVAGSGWFPPDIKPEEFEPRLARAARDLAEIGIYTVDVKDGMVYFTVSPASCTPTPQPDIMEGRAVDPRWARKGYQAVQGWNEGHIAGLKTVTKVVSPPCMPE
jgi:hypothetical protein